MERPSSDWASFGVRKDYLNRLLSLLRRLPDRRPIGEEDKSDVVGRSRAVRVAADLSLAMTARGATWSRNILSQSRKMSPNFIDFIRTYRAKNGKKSMSKRLSRPKARDRWRTSFLRMRRTLYSLRRQPSGSRMRVVYKTIPRKHVSKLNAWSKKSMRILLRGVSRDERSKRQEETRTWDARIKMLQSLVPGGRSMDTPVLLQEVADYILALKMQVDTMQTLANYLTMNSTGGESN